MSKVDNSLLLKLGNLINKNISGFGSTTEKLATGQRINKASDDPAAFIVSEQLEGQIAATSQAIRNIETDISLLQTVDAANEEIGSLIKYLKQNALAASNSVLTDQIIRENNQQSVQTVLKAIDNIAQQTTFGSKPLLNGSAGAHAAVSGQYLQFIKAGANTKPTNTSPLAVEVLQRATQSFWLGSDAITPSKLLVGSTLTAVEGGRMAKYEVTANDNINTIQNNFQRAIDSVGLPLVVDTNPGNKFLIYHRDYGSKHSFEVASSVPGLLSPKSDELVSAIKGQDVQAVIGDTVFKGDGQLMMGPEGSDFEGLVLRYRYDNNDLSNPYVDNSLAGYVQIYQNSLHFQNYPNYDSGFWLSLQNLTTSNLGGLANSSKFKNLAEIDISTVKNATESLKVIDAADQQLLAFRSEIASVQKHRLESSLAHLMNTRENLLAAVSNIKDVDYAKEVIDNIKYNLQAQYGYWALNNSFKLQQAAKDYLIFENNDKNS